MKNTLYVCILIVLFAYSAFMISGCGSVTSAGSESLAGNAVKDIYLANQTLGGFFIVDPGTVSLIPLITTVECEIVTLDAAALVNGIAITADKKRLFVLGIKPHGAGYPDTSSLLSVYDISNESFSANYSYTFADSDEAFGNYILGFSTNGDTVYVARRRVVGIYEISTSTGSITASFDAWTSSCDAFTGGAVGPDGMLYFGNHEFYTGGSVYRYNTTLTTHTVDAVIDYGADGNCHFMRINSAGTKLYVPMQGGLTSDIVHIVNIPSFADSGASDTVGNDPLDVGLSGNGKAYTPDFTSGKFSMFVISDNTTGGTDVLLDAGMGPNAIVMDDARNRAYVDGASLPRLSVINTANDQLLKNIILPSSVGTDQMAFRLNK